MSSFFRFLSRRRTGRRGVPDQRERTKKGHVVCKVILLDATDCTLDVKVLLF